MTRTMLRSPRKTIKRVARVWVVTDRRQITGVSERAGADLEWHALEFQIRTIYQLSGTDPGRVVRLPTRPSIQTSSWQEW
jgi:hypothetical protein